MNISNLVLISKKTSKLSNKEIKSICLLKNTYWKYGISDQLKWFKINVKSYDIHNMLLINNELVGYTLLRSRKIRFNTTKKYFLVVLNLIFLDRSNVYPTNSLLINSIL